MPIRMVWNANTVSGLPVKHVAASILLTAGLCGALGAVPPVALAQAATSGADSDASAVAPVVVKSRANLIGAALTASQGSITAEEIEQRPVYRVGQLLEAMPGLVVTVHSGEGKANQYLLRGENLDHGIDLANFIDDMPINRPTNAHGQGYSDLNFIVPALVEGIDFTKGPYFADLGDFGGVGAIHMRLRDVLAPQMSVSAGTLGDQDGFLGGSVGLGGSRNLLGALDLSHLDGPFTHPDNFRKIAGALRWSQGDGASGDSLTALYYKGQGRNTTDQPLRAITSGLISAYGALDPTDGNRAERESLSLRHVQSGSGWKLTANLYAVHSTMTLWNNFTHDLNDPVQGDQEQQDETRTTLGGGAAYSRTVDLGGVDADLLVGGQDRHDVLYADRRHTRRRTVLDYCNDGAGDYSVGLTACTADQVRLNDAALYVQSHVRLTPWLNVTAGLRDDYATASDHSAIPGHSRGEAGEQLVQPKFDLRLGPWADTEIYVSAGKGFHSDDVRGVLGAVPVQGVPFAVGPVPLMARTWAEEIGIRNASLPGLKWQLAVFDQIYSSELIYNQDAGQDQATAPSRRRGVELSAQYHPVPNVEISVDVASTRARFFENANTLATFYGIAGGASIANAPTYTASVGVLVERFGPWSAGVETRVLGPYPLTNGPARPMAAGYDETNADIDYRVTARLTVRLAIFNLFNTRAYSAEYYYATAITPQEVARFGAAGVNDFQVHPLEPLSAKMTVTALF